MSKSIFKFGPSPPRPTVDEAITAYRAAVKTHRDLHAAANKLEVTLRMTQAQLIDAGGKVNSARGILLDALERGA